jgi:hypothetical protein
MVEHQVVVLGVEGSIPSLRPTLSIIHFLKIRGSSSVVEHEPVALGAAGSNPVSLVNLMGHRQVVRRWILVPPCKGSNPFVPTQIRLKAILTRF